MKCSTRKRHKLCCSDQKGSPIIHPIKHQTDLIHLHTQALGNNQRQKTNLPAARQTPKSKSQAQGLSSSRNLALNPKQRKSNESSCENNNNL